MLNCHILAAFCVAKKPSFQQNVKTAAIFFALFLCVFAFSGCSATQLLDVGKAVIGMPADDSKPVEVPVSISAGANLNENNGTPMSVVGRVYYLKSLDAWASMTADQLMSDDAEKSLGTSLVESHEIILTPGSTFSATEKVPKEATFLGVSVFFYAAAPQRWKYAFNVEQSKKTGLALGAHACALTVTKGATVPLPNMALSHDPKSLAFVRCVQPR